MNATRLTVASFNKMAQDDFRGGRVLALVRPRELSKIDAFRGNSLFPVRLELSK
jgi:hypothetical protein